MDKKGYLDMQLLRFTTAGSVDDGKSTLIGRLLYDSKSIFEDQLEAVEEASRSRGNEEVNLALLTDGLRAEREQGITIDVAYRYFATPKRKFIIADTPGHIQYTRNMVTGASTADLAVILVDARHGIMEQTIRHSYVASLLAIPELVVAVNKMDLVDFDREVFDGIVRDYREMLSKFGLHFHGVNFIPMSAKDGDNVVSRSERTPWYGGESLLEFLENVQLPSQAEDRMRLPVQYVIRPISSRFPDFRGYAGLLAEGSVRTGDRVRVYPGCMESEVTGIYIGDKQIDSAVAGQSVCLTLKDDIDISRGDIVVSTDGIQPGVASDFSIDVCWFRNSPLVCGKRYTIRHATREVLGIVKEIEYKVDINTQERICDVEQLVMNDIARVHLRTAEPLVFDRYRDNRTMGSLIFIDATNDTVGAGMIADEY
ncbi:MAG: GTP-binding protein [Bacteroidales bacterium]|nr:GTP-binding protein [Bacteroidales bacterium]